MDLRVGLFADVDGIARAGGYGIRYDVLRDFAARRGFEPIRLNAYTGIDLRRDIEEPNYRENAASFHAALRDFGYKVTQRPIALQTDEAGNTYQLASVEIDMAVDVITQSERLDRVVLVTGNGAFAGVAAALQNRGCRVEVIGFNGIAEELRKTADFYIPGCLIPNLAPAGGEGRWGAIGSRVRGVCYSFSHDRGFGFLRFLKEVGPNLWNVDTRCPNSPYCSAFAHESAFPPEIERDALPSRDYIFEFTLATSERGLQAKDITVSNHSAEGHPAPA